MARLCLCLRLRTVYLPDRLRSIVEEWRANVFFQLDFRRLLVILVLYPVEANHSIRRLF